MSSTAHPARVSQVDPRAGYLTLKPEIDAAIARVLESGRYLFGLESAALERDFAAWLGVNHAVGCGNGTDALALALRALGAGPGTAVATVSHTAVATVAAIEMAGAAPILLDIDPSDYTMDPEELVEVLQYPSAGLPPIRAVIPVHLYGQPAALDRITPLCEAFGVALLEDCAQAHGAALNERKIGTFGQAAAFSFYPTKNLAALGDAGMVVTSDPRLAARMGALRQYGWQSRRVAVEAGINSRLDEIQAAIVRVRLPYLERQNARRRIIAAAYDAALSGSSIAPPRRRAKTSHVFHQYVVRTEDRAGLQEHLDAEGIETSIHYPVPVHLQPAYAARVVLGPARCRVTERVRDEILSLPLYPELTDAEVLRVCNALRRYTRPRVEAVKLLQRSIDTRPSDSNAVAG